MDMGRAPKTKVYKSKTQPSHHFPMWIRCGLRANTTGVQTRNPLMWHDLIKWLAPLKVKLFSRMLGWKLVCFLVDDTPQELTALW